MKFIKELIPYLIIIVVVVLIRTFIITPVRVDGLSMYPTLKDGEILLLKKYDKSFDRFDIVVVKYGNTKIVKRIIGLPGDNLKFINNKLYINGEIINEDFLNDNVKTADFNINKFNIDIIPEGYYFVMGDNRGNSTDSRIIGVVPSKNILGITDFSLFPFSTFGKIRWGNECFR